ncbi:GNAT family N-acetyltransferase [Clostridium sp. C2-6-12]|uniref:GNAT family N-acetyltransferase n=1 Tax=Clostridium sp. C2-6-12 TaxID=2698832 RepID=UPI0013687A24|nr:GNAT family N-acetyltransferase [Clostridium sp. C2-6-12]
MKITYKINVVPKVEELIQLYNNIGWHIYTQDAKKLERAFINSSVIVSAWDNYKLVGVLRAVGDSETIMYIQDILVDEIYQSKGIGRQLIGEFMNEYEDVRQIVLITDKTLKTMHFYEVCGFDKVETYDGIAYVKYTV